MSTATTPANTTRKSALSDPDLNELIAAATECAEDLEAYVEAEWPIDVRIKYLSCRMKYELDMAPVRRLRQAIAQATR